MEPLKSAVWQTVKEKLTSMPDLSYNAECLARRLADQIERESAIDEAGQDLRQRLARIQGITVI